MTLKRVVERAAVASGLLSYLRRRRPGTLVLAYHNIVPDDHPPIGDRSLHLPRSQFAAQLDELQSTCDVVPLDAVFAVTTTSTRPRVAITFDDCYQGAVELGVTELARRGLPATFFVAPGLLGGKTFWWDGLADPTGGLSPATRDHVLTACQGRTEAAYRWATTTRTPWQPQDGPGVTCTAAGLNQAVASGLVTVGCHTWSHPNVKTLPSEDLRNELSQTRQWLAEQVGDAARAWITWPYGLSNGAAHDVAAAERYQAGFRVDGGWMAEGTTGFDLPRFNVPAGLSLDGFRMRLAGLLAS